MKLDTENIRTLVAAKTFADTLATSKINHINFSPNGDFLVTSSDDDQIIMYDCIAGKKKTSINSKKYGSDLVHFTHTGKEVIHASTKVDNTIRLLNVEEKKYLMYFREHTGKVTSIVPYPFSPVFLSASLDDTVRLWDTRTKKCQGLMTLPPNSNPIVAFDPEGRVFSVGIHSETVMFYDLQNFTRGPFITESPFQKPDTVQWTGMKISPDGKQLLVMTNDKVLRILDAMDGKFLRNLEGHENDKNVHLRASFSPCGKFVFCGSTDYEICIWEMESGKLINKMKTAHISTPENVVFNPNYCLMASACSTLRLWIPNAKTDK
ncbi:WD repeat-containing protein 82 [Ditylenchus destructor]|uniref:WD repeat-containing protein 82 n=1 Tax=Ditylenchus destructor TaxID=166010 RepID=A0AAD4MMJ2_9BILA|nr:WD repeat-containing protein 82 [Ditylenchus destructor]